MTSSTWSPPTTTPGWRSSCPGRRGAYERVYIEPTSGEFDVDAIDAFVSAIEYSSRDPQWPNAFLLAEDLETLDEHVEIRRDDRFPPLVIRVGISSTRILLISNSSRDRPAQTFARWLVQTFDVRFLDEQFNVVDRAADSELAALLGGR